MELQTLINGETYLSVRAKLNTMLSALITGSEGVNEIWVKLRDLINSDKTLQGNIDTLADDLAKQLLDANDYTDSRVSALKALISSIDGNFYGFYPSSTNLPTGSVAGYAYVATANANEYTIWNYIGTTLQWINSGMTKVTSDSIAPLIVNLTNTSGTYTADKTFAEVIAAFATRALIVFKYNNGTDTITEWTVSKTDSTNSVVVAYNNYSKLTYKNTAITLENIKANEINLIGIQHIHDIGNSQSETSDIYSLTEAINAIPVTLQKGGIKCTFRSCLNGVQSWVCNNNIFSTDSRKWEQINCLTPYINLSGVQRYNLLAKIEWNKGSLKVTGYKKINESNDLFYCYTVDGRKFYISDSIGSRIEITGGNVLYVDLSKGSVFSLSDIQVADLDIPDIKNFISTHNDYVIIGITNSNGLSISSPIVDSYNNIKVSNFVFKSFIKELCLTYTYNPNKVYYITDIMRNFLYSGTTPLWRFDIWEADDINGTNGTRIAQYYAQNLNQDNISYISGANYSAIVDFSVVQEDYDYTDKYQIGIECFNLASNPILKYIYNSGFYEIEKFNPKAILRYYTDTKTLAIYGNKINSSNDLFRVHSNMDTRYIQGSIGLEKSFSLSGNGYLYWDNVNVDHNISDLIVGYGVPSDTQVVFAFFWYNGASVYSPYIDEVKNRYSLIDQKFLKEIYLNTEYDNTKTYYVSYIQRNYLHPNTNRYWRFDIFKADDINGTNSICIAEFISTVNSDNASYILTQVSGSYICMEAIVNFMELDDGINYMGKLYLDKTSFDKNYSPTIKAIDAKNTANNLDNLQDLIMPDNIYVLKNHTTTICHDSIISRYFNIDDKVRLSESDDYATATNNSWKGISDFDAKRFTKLYLSSERDISAKLYHDNILKNKKNITIKIGDLSATNNTYVVHGIGDSLSRGFQYHYVENNCPNVTCVGTRDFSNFKENPIAKADGYPGYTLASILNESTLWSGDVNICSPFIHPNGTYNNCKFYGKTNAWIATMANNNELSGCLYNKGIEFGINPITGLRNNPKTNDMMYNYSLGKFVVWNGTEWAQVSNVSFELNYTKFLQIWNIGTPNIVSFMFGNNDYFDYNKGYWDSGIDTLFTNEMNRFIASIKVALPNVIILVLTTTPIAADAIRSPNYGTSAFLKYKCRKNIIESFDNRQDENIYVIDSMAFINIYDDYPRLDADNNYPYIYNSTERSDAIDKVTNAPWLKDMTYDEIHCINNGNIGGYSHIGESISAFIQWFRAK